MKIHEIIEKTLLEMERAETLHPEWPKDTIHQVAIVCEEAGEALRAANQYVYEEAPLKNLEDELYQTAGACFRMLKYLREEKPPDNSSEIKIVEKVNKISRVKKLSGDKKSKVFTFLCYTPQGEETVEYIDAPSKDEATRRFKVKFPTYKLVYG